MLKPSTSASDRPASSTARTIASHASSNSVRSAPPAFQYFVSPIPAIAVRSRNGHDSTALPPRAAGAARACVLALPAMNARGNPRLVDVAERAGVTISTASRALARPEMVRSETRERVLAAAEELGYEPN